MDQENFLQLYVFMLNEYLNLISSFLLTGRHVDLPGLVCVTSCQKATF